MNYHKSKTVQEARRKGKVVIMEALTRVGIWRTLRVTKSKPALWQEGASKVGAKKSDIYSVDHQVSIITLYAMLNGWKIAHDKPMIEFKSEGEVSISHFYALACLCIKLKMFPKVRG